MQTLVYPTCNRTAFTTGTVAAFDNQPPAGCEVVLVDFGQTFELCAGRGIVPVAFRDAPQIRVRPGSSVPCGFGPAAA